MLAFIVLTEDETVAYRREVFLAVLAPDFT